VALYHAAVPEEEVYDIGGLRIASPTPLAARRAVGAADYAYRIGTPRPIDGHLPPGDLVAERLVGGYRQYAFCRAGEVVVARFHGLLDFEIDLASRTVTSHAQPGSDPGFAPILVTGTISAFLLTVAGWLVLHASAVEVDGGVLAFVGPSGQGKSTVAALCCASGFPLVSDDLLPVLGDGDGRVRCTPGGVELRLRPKVAELAGLFGSDATVYETADRRQAVGPSTTAMSRLLLRAVVIPSPGRGRTNVEVAAVPAGEAALLLTAFHRIEGWKDRAQLSRTFQTVMQVVASVPVLRMAVPWGPPFAEDLGRRIVGEVTRSGPAAGLDRAR